MTTLGIQNPLSRIVLWLAGCAALSASAAASAVLAVLLAMVLCALVAGRLT